MNTITSNFYIIEFKKKLVETENKKYLLENEIRQIELFVSSNEASYMKSTSLITGMTGSISKTNSVFDLSYLDSYGKERFNLFFNKNLLGESYNPEDYKHNDWFENDIFPDANAFADYYKWLKELNEESSSKTSSKKSGLTHKQKMLTLHYLGLDLSKFENTNSAKILSKILDLDYDNTRKYLSYLSIGKNEVRTKSNLETLIKMFDIQGFEEITNTIKKDIEKL